MRNRNRELEESLIATGGWADLEKKAREELEKSFEERRTGRFEPEELDEEDTEEFYYLQALREELALRGEWDEISDEGHLTDGCYWRKRLPGAD